MVFRGGGSGGDGKGGRAVFGFHFFRVKGGKGGGVMVVKGSKNVTNIGRRRTGEQKHDQHGAPNDP